jgi:hypothetical protein
METSAIGLAGIAGGVQEFFCLRGIVIVLGRGRIIGPMIGRKEAAGFAGFIAEDLVD